MHRYSDDYVSVTELKEFAYCPMIPWIHRYLGFYTEPTESMSVARERADSSFKERVAERLGLPRPWRFEVPVRSRELGLRGVVDILAGERRYVVVEVKYYRRKRRRLTHFRRQLLAYTLIVNETLGPVREAILYNGGEVIRIPVSREVLEEIRRYVKALRRVLESEAPPVVNQQPSKCSYCWYRHVCPMASTS